jgi:hypothetical protein
MIYADPANVEPQRVSRAEGALSMSKLTQIRRMAGKPI